jgi:hypothetical protein
VIKSKLKEHFGGAMGGADGASTSQAAFDSSTATKGASDDVIDLGVKRGKVQDSAGNHVSAVLMVFSQTQAATEALCLDSTAYFTMRSACLWPASSTLAIWGPQSLCAA